MEPGSPFLSRQPYQPSSSGENTIPESRATRSPTSPLACNQQPCVEDGKRVADCANREMRGVMKNRVSMRNINAIILK